MTYAEFAKQNKISLTAARTDKNPLMSGAMTHWKATLKAAGHRMTLTFSKGSGHKGAPPTVEEVLQCLSQDAYYIDDSGSTFEDFCHELGYDTDSRKAEKIYKAVVRQTHKLKSFLGTTFDDLLNCEEA